MSYQLDFIITNNSKNLFWVMYSFTDHLVNQFSFDFIDVMLWKNKCLSQCIFCFSLNLSQDEKISTLFMFPQCTQNTLTNQVHLCITRKSAYEAASTLTTQLCFSSCKECNDCMSVNNSKKLHTSPIVNSTPALLTSQKNVTISTETSSSYLLETVL